MNPNNIKYLNIYIYLLIKRYLRACMDITVIFNRKFYSLTLEEEIKLYFSIKHSQIRKQDTLRYL